MFVAVVFTAKLSLLSAAVLMSIVTVVFHYILRRTQANATPPIPKPRQGLLGIIIGKDLRTSTSKFQMVVWTYSVALVLIAMLLLGRVVGSCDDECETTFSKVLEGKGLTDLFESGFEAEYLILLGFPGLAGVIAKGLTSSRVANQQIVKDDAPEGRSGTDYLADIVSDDAGKGDLGDFQYFVFNAIAVGYFFVGWLDSPTEGLPSLPGTLVALTGTSAGLYVAKKATDASTPVITEAAPPIVQQSADLTLKVDNLLGPDATQTTVVVLFDADGDGVFEVTASGTYDRGSVVVGVPAGLVPQGASQADVAVMVRGPSGRETGPFKLVVK